MQQRLLVKFSCNSPTLYLIALLRALLVVRSFVLEWWVVATTLSHLHFSLHKDIFNYKDINCFSFFNNNNIFFMLNIYSDNYQFALKYLKNTETNLQNILIIASNFNIRNNIWNSLYLFHLIHSNFLFDIADSLDLKLFIHI